MEREVTYTPLDIKGRFEVGLGVVDGADDLGHVERGQGHLLLEHGEIREGESGVVLELNETLAEEEKLLEGEGSKQVIK
jgi:hypothetical protein